MKIPDSISQEEFEKIESYLLKSMSNSQQKIFEKELSENKALSAKFHTVKSMVNGIEEIAFRENLEGIHQEWEANASESQKKSWIWIRYSIAASIILVIGFFSWLFWLRPDVSEQLFATYYQADPGLVTAMGGSMEYEFDRGMVDYKTGNYPAAIQRWEDLIQENPGNDTINYFLGAAHLELNNTTPAKHYLQKVLESDGSKFKEEAIWYLALVNVLERDYEKAIIHLNQSDHPDKDKLTKSIQER